MEMIIIVIALITWICITGGIWFWPNKNSGPVNFGFDGVIKTVITCLITIVILVFTVIALVAIK